LLNGRHLTSNNLRINSLPVQRGTNNNKNNKKVHNKIDEMEQNVKVKKNF